jgi:hypothetical protein
MKDKQTKQIEAKQRQMAWDRLSLQEKLEIVAARPGYSARETLRLAAQIKASQNKTA